ncbi:MAG: PrsW family intramembrane metalloprotease [Candidatus Eisenbacteria bacterium]
MDLSTFARGLGLAVAGAIVWLLYFDQKDKAAPEPRHRLLIAVLAGTLSAGLASLVFSGIEHLGYPEPERGPLAGTAVLCFGFIGPIEEACKALPFVLLVLRFREFDETIDGIIYASAIAIGFAAAETALYVPRSSVADQVARAFASPLTHAVFASVWGYGFAHAKFLASTRLQRVAWPLLSWLLAAAAHGLYDFAIFAFDASLVASGVTLSLWLAMLHKVRSLTRAGETMAEATPPPPPSHSEGDVLPRSDTEGPSRLARF